MGNSSYQPGTKSTLSAIVLAFLCSLAFTTGSAKDNAPAPLPTISESEAIQLPKYEVTTDRVLPPIEQWSYVSIPGFEILSNASDRNTKEFVRDFYLLRQVAQIILPTVKETSGVPTYIVLCGQGNAFETFIPESKQSKRHPNSVFASDIERSAIVINFTFADQFGEIHDSIRMGGGNDPFHQFYLQYFRQLITRSIKPTPPKWLTEGLVQLLAATDFSSKKITFAKVDGDERAAPSNSFANQNNGWGDLSRSNTPTGRIQNQGGSRYNNGFSGHGLPDLAPSSARSRDQNGTWGKTGSFNAILSHKTMVSLEKFFAYDSDEPGEQHIEYYPTYAYLFTHLCLYGRGQRYTKAYFKLAKRASQGPITESVFQDCFGMTFKSMEKEMRSYVTFTDYKSIERKATKGNELSSAPDFKLRDATDAESSRIAGEVLRLTGNRDAALNRLIAPYVRGQYDADLLAALGLAELSASHKERARRFLEAAAKANTTRTRAYVELATLRFNEIQSKAAAENRSATAEEFAWVQAPLLQGQKHPPALASLYDLLARTWYFSPAAPTKEEFEMLAAGAQQNYTDLGLVYRVAALGLKHDQIETSRRFITFGTANSPDPETKAKFEELASHLPPSQGAKG